MLEFGTGLKYWLAPASPYLIIDCYIFERFYKYVTPNFEFFRLQIRPP